MSSTLIEQAYHNFSLYTLEDRALLYFEDGLRASIRRGIWVSRNLPTTKTATVAGYMMPLHPHGDADEVLQNFTSPYKMSHPYFNGNDAGFGTLLEPSNYSASRYTSISLSSFAKDVILADVELLEMKPNYDEKDVEPKFLLPLVPIHLLNGVYGMAVGFKCSIVPYKLAEVIEQQINVLSKKAQTELTPYFKPLDQRAIGCKTSAKGNVIWTFQGSVKKVKNNIWKVTSLPYEVTHSKFIEHLHSLIEDGVIRKFVDQSKKTIDCDVYFKTVEDEDSVMSILRLTNNKTEIINLINITNLNVEKFTPLELIEKFTNWRLSYYIKRYQFQMNKIKESMQKNKDILIAIDLITKGKMNVTKINKSQMIEILAQNNVVNVDYVASLPIYRFNSDQAEIIRQELLSQQQEIDSLAEIISSDSKLRKAYVTDLKTVHKKYA